MMSPWHLVERVRGFFLVPALALAPVALAAAPAPPITCPPNAVAGVVLSSEALYQEQQFESAALIVRLGLESCGAGAADLARFHVLEGMLKIEAFKEEEARAAFAAALALDGSPALPAFMPPAARRIFEAVKATVPARKELKVVEVVGGRVLFAAGTEDGFRPGSKVRVVPPQQQSSTPAAVLRVVEAQAHTAMAELGRGEQVEPGDLVLPTDEPLSGHLFFPRRAPFTSRIGFHVRPSLAFPVEFPLGVLMDGYYAWYVPSLPIALQVRLAPFGGAGGVSLAGGGDAHYPTVFAATGSWVTDFFEIGLGLGTAFGHYFSTGPSWNLNLTFDQILRVGSIDGLNFGWESSLFLGPGWFGLGRYRAELNVPFTARLGAFGTLGRGSNGFAFAEGGCRWYLRGAGGRGTLILSASGGYTWFFDGIAMVGGPSLGFGMEWRL